MTDAKHRLSGIRLLLRTAIVLVVYGCCAVGAAFAQAPDGCSPPPAPQAVDFSNAPNLDLIKAQILYYRCTRYDADIAAVVDEAKRWVALRAAQVASPAIVLDIDDTSLSNWARIYKDDYAYFAKGPCNLDSPGEACGDGAWEASERAPAIGPTLGLYKLARCIAPESTCRKIEVFFVTGRHVSDQRINGKTPTEWTLENLDRVGYVGLNPDHLYMRPANSNGPVAPFKTAARADIETRFKVTIIANVGDQESDLAGGHAERTFKLPNPFYFLP